MVPLVFGFAIHIARRVKTVTSGQHVCRAHALSTIAGKIIFSSSVIIWLDSDSLGAKRTHKTTLARTCLCTHAHVRECMGYGANVYLQII